MAKLTLLEIVQDILNDMDSDKVSSINDTVESDQVAQIVKTCYFELIGNRNWPHLQKLIQLQESGDLAKPNYLVLPDNLKEVTFIKYEKQGLGDSRIVQQDVKYKYPDDFLRYVSGRNSTAGYVDTIVDYNGSKLLIVNNQPPTYWTSFDDVHLVTDAYDAAIDDTLKSSKTQCLAFIEPSWTSSDVFIPDLPMEAFPLLLAESKSTAFIVLKQMANQKAEQKATRQSAWLSRKAWKAHGGVRYDDYGRKARR